MDALTAASNAPGTALAHAALVIATIEYPRLVPEPYVAQLDGMGAMAAKAIAAHVDETGDRSTLGRLEDGYFVQFPLELTIPANLAGRSLTFKTVEFYSNGENAFWIGPPSATYRMKKFLRRNRGPAIATGVVFLALIA